MKTAISVPNGVYEQAEALAQRTGRSRSEIYSTALREYLTRHDADPMTAAIDSALEDIEPAPDEFVAAAAHKILANVEW